MARSRDPRGRALPTQGPAIPRGELDSIGVRVVVKAGGEHVAEEAREEDRSPFRRLGPDLLERAGALGERLSHVDRAVQQVDEYGP
jgi:hypothetical protein